MVLSAFYHSMEPSQSKVSSLSINLNQDQPSNGLANTQKQELDRLQQEWFSEKINRKKEWEKVKKDLHGPSSSEEDDIGNTESESDGEADKRKSTVEEERRFRESVNGLKAKKEEEKLAVLFSIKKVQGAWKEEVVGFSEQALLISERQCYLKDIHKVKAIQGQKGQLSHRIKLSTIQSQELLLEVKSRPFKETTLHYFVFAWVIQQKLTNMGYKLRKCQAPSLPGIPASLTNGSYIFGKVSKKSRVLGKWEQRVVVVNQDGIWGYKRFNDKHVMFIDAGSIREVWTRFEVEDGMLVVKVLHSSTKVELGFVLEEVLDPRCWLWSVCRLAFPTQLIQ